MSTSLSPVSPEERRRQLIARLSADGRLVAAELATEFGTSEDTIRRDLRELAAAGLVQRVHGGALPVSPALASFSTRARQETPAKAALAGAAAKRLRRGQTVLFDGGTTTLAIARALPPDLTLTAVTPCPPVAAALGEHPGAEVIVLGGRLDKNLQAVVGADAVDTVRTIRADVCLLGVCSLDAEAGVTVGSYEETHLKRAMVAAAAEVVAVVTASKLGTGGPHVVGPIDLLTHGVPERHAPEPVLAALAHRGVAVTLV